MKLHEAARIALVVGIAKSTPINSDYAFTLVKPGDRFSIKVPSQLMVEACQDLNFGPPCVNTTLSPGLCYLTPTFGVTAIQPARDVSGCSLFRSNQCDSSEGEIEGVVYPGIADLTTYGFNDEVNSIICY